MAGGRMDQCPASRHHRGESGPDVRSESRSVGALYRQIRGIMSVLRPTASERKHRAFIPRGGDRSTWTSLDYAYEITDATDTGHLGWAELLMMEFRRKFLAKP
jgi:hypothetical protein